MPDPIPTTSLSHLDTTPVGWEAAAAIEAAEARAWADLVAAAPRDYAAEIGLEAGWIAGALVLRYAGGGFDRPLFNRPIGLGVVQPATREAVAEVLGVYRAAGVTGFMLVSQPHCRPEAFEQWLQGKGLQPAGTWDRVVRGAAPARPLSPVPGRDLRVERVTAESAHEWAEMLAVVYRLHAEPWLLALQDRPDWHHLVVRERGKVIAARSMYCPRAGLGFLAIDGPVPGIMTMDFEPDAALCAALVAEGLAGGARGFVADIEAPSAALDSPAYTFFARLGFARPYSRTHVIDPWAVAANGAVVALLSGLVVIGKFVIVAVILLLLGLPGRVAVLAGLSLAQVGEFSFVLARVGVDQGVIPHLFFDLILATSLTSIVLAPLTLKAAPHLICALQHTAPARAPFPGPSRA